MINTADITPKINALGQESRLDILKHLIKEGSDGIKAGDLASLLNIPAPTLSFHLKAMRLAGLIAARREGRTIYYLPDYGGIREMIDFLLIDCCDGDKRLCGPYIINKPRSDPQ